jgi:hypothetical protein
VAELAITEDIIELAFDLPPNLGVDLLLRLGTLDLWRGDLAAMREDVPRSEPSPALPPAVEALTAAEKLYAVVLMHTALKYLEPECRKTLLLRYRERRDVRSIAKELGCTARYAETLIQTCRERAGEIARMLDKNGSVDSAVGPDDAPRERQVPAAHRRKATG